jgi:hypothetical protein
VVVQKRRVEILYDPDARRGLYRSRRTLSEDDTLAPAFAPDLNLRVRSLFG